jgi:AcrR family transcriptional regulator
VIEEKRAHIVEAATTVFVRYGFSRATMADVAKQAELSRQALYRLFPNKEELLRAAMTTHSDAAIKAIETGLEHAQSMPERLELFNELAAVSAFELMDQSPDAKDLIEGCNQVGHDIAERTSVRFAELLDSALEPFRSEIIAAGMSPEELAQLLYASASSFKLYASDAAHLRKLLSEQVALIGRALRTR